VTRFHIFIMRAIVGLAMAVLLTRMFYGNTNIVYSAGVATILVGLAYFAEFLRSRKDR